MISANLFLLESYFLPETLNRLPKFIHAMEQKNESEMKSIFMLQTQHLLQHGYKCDPHFESFKNLIKWDKKRIINKLRLFRADCSMLAPPKPGDAEA